MEHPFATLLIPAQIGTLPPADQRIVRLAAIAPGGQCIADVTLADTGTLYVTPVDGGPVLAISLVAVANAALKASGSKRQDGAA